MKHQHTNPSLAQRKPFLVIGILLAFVAALVATGVPRAVQAEELATPDEGVYVISSSVGEDKVLDINGANTSNGGNVQIYQNNGTFAQYWRIERVGEHYRICNSITGATLDVANGAAHNGANVQVYQWNETGAQLWDFIKQDEGYAIRSVCSGLMLDVDSGSNANYANVQVYEGNGTKAQSWVLNQVDADDQLGADGLYTISSAINGNKLFDVANGSRSDGASVQLWDQNGSLAQKWRIAFDDSTGFYTIVSAVSGRALDVPSGNSHSGAKLNQYSQNGSAAQLWRIAPASEGGYTITSALGRAVDVANGIAGSGTHLQLWDANGTAAQRWSFTPAEIDLSGLYQVESSISSKAVWDVSNASKAEDAKIQVWESNGTLAQKWKFSKLENGSYSIRNANSGLYLADDGSGKLKSFASFDSAAAQWQVTIGNGGYTFINAGSGKVIDLSSANTTAGTVVGTYQSNGTAAQAWVLTNTSLVDDGCYTLVNGSGSKQVLDVPNGSSSSGEALQTYSSNGTAAQKWLVESAGSGWYTITNVGSGLALDVRNAVAQSGSVVQQYESNSTSAQLWKFDIAENGGIQVVSKLGNFALAIEGDTAESGSDVIIDTPGAGKKYSWTFEPTTYVQEVNDIWGDSAYVNQMRERAAQVGSKTGIVAVVDKSRDRTTVFSKSGNKWALVNSMDVLTSGNTFTGVYEVYITARGYWKEPDCIDVNDWYVGYAEDWWNSPSSSHMRYVEGEGYDEGQGFHYGFYGSGCICIPDYNSAKWLHDNLTVGSTVYIF